jgi:hypothetical protein
MKKSEQVTDEQLRELTEWQQVQMLHFLRGYLEKSPSFQEALKAAYRSQTETPGERKARLGL